MPKISRRRQERILIVARNMYQAEWITGLRLTDFMGLAACAVDTLFPEDSPFKEEAHQCVR